MSNTIMNTIYNHYLTSYMPVKGDARLDSHKKSELRDIYSRIVRMNKEAPLYMLDRSEETKSLAVSLKENARSLQHTILQTAGKSQEDLFHNKVAYSDNENILTAQFVGDNHSSADISPHEITVESLATPQVNMGRFLKGFDMDLPEGNYSFDVNINGMGYEFQYKISAEDTNYDIQSKLVRLINNANIGLNASMVEGLNDTYSIRLASSRTGVPEGTDSAFQPLFTINDHLSSRMKGSVDYFGLDYIMNPASNAQFTVDGEAQSSPGNSFTLDKNYLINLTGTTPDSGQPVQIGIKPNTESLVHNIQSLIGGYNSFLKAMGEYQSSRSSSAKLIHEFNGITNLYYNELDAIGIVKEADGSLNIDSDLLTQAASSDEAADLLAPLKNFSDSLYQKSETVSRDPLNYMNKIIVAYKNPGKNFPSPYFTSNYSGLLFNYYC